jgi:hypothetical protein
VSNIRAGLCAFRVWHAPCVREHLDGEHHGLRLASCAARVARNTSAFILVHVRHLLRPLRKAPASSLALGVSGGCVNERRSKRARLAAFAGSIVLSVKSREAHRALLLVVWPSHPNPPVERDASQACFARLLAPLTFFRCASQDLGLRSLLSARM